MNIPVVGESQYGVIGYLLNIGGPGGPWPSVASINDDGTITYTPDDPTDGTYTITSIPLQPIYGWSNPRLSNFLFLTPNFYSLSFTTEPISQTYTFVPSTHHFYYSPGFGIGSGFSFTGGHATDPDGFASELSGSGCFFMVVGGCVGASGSSDVAYQYGFGLGGWGAAVGYGVDPIQELEVGMYTGTPSDPLATVPAGGLDWEDPMMYVPH